MLYKEYLSKIGGLFHKSLIAEQGPGNAGMPFKNLYDARKYLNAIKKIIDETLKLESLNADISSELNKILIIVNLKLGINHTQSEETPDGTKFLNENIPLYTPLYEITNLEEEIPDVINSEWCDEVEDNPIEADNCLSLLSQSMIYISACNEAGILHSEYEEEDDALKTFELANTMYSKISKEIGENKFKYSEKERNNFEILFTHTTFFLAQHYGNYGDEKQASYYCGLTLYRQLNYNSYVPHEWIKNCLSFSEVFFGRGYINITLPLIKKCEEVYEKSNFEGDSDYQLEAKGNIDITYAAIYCTSLKNCWILESTGEPIERKEISPNLMEILDLIVNVNVVSNIPESIPSIVTSDSNNNEQSQPLPLPSSSSSSNNNNDNNSVPDTTDTIINNNNNNNNNDIYLNTPPSNINIPEGDKSINYDEALVLFKSSNHYYNKAKLYFRIDGWVTDYINILKDQSKLYHYLSAYVIESSKRITMNQKRIDLLEPIIGELNTQAFSNIITELHYELGEIYSESLDEKIRKINKKQEEAESNGTTYKLKKIELQKLRLFSSKCMYHFEEFTKYYFKEGKRPDTLDDREGIQPYIHASFNIARMLTKMADTYEIDLKEKIEYDKKSYLYYKYVAEFGNNNINLLNDESKNILKMAEEFASLLPSKLDQISAQLRAQKH